MHALDKCLRKGSRYDYQTHATTPTEFFNFSNLTKFIDILEEETGFRQGIDFAFMYDRSRYSQKIHLVISRRDLPGIISALEIRSSITEVSIANWEKILTFLKGK